MLKGACSGLVETFNKKVKDIKIQSACFDNFDKFYNIV